MAPYILKDPAKYDFKTSYSKVHDDVVSCIEKLSNGNLVSGSLDSTLRIWDASTGQLYRVFEGHTHEVA
jgi:proteasomal ATPase-associated factor 1